MSEKMTSKSPFLSTSLFRPLPNVHFLIKVGTGRDSKYKGSRGNGLPVSRPPSRPRPDLPLADGKCGWSMCAKTCYHTQAGRPAPRNGRPAPALIGAHKQEIPTRDIGEAPEEIREIHARLRRREATDDEVARLDEWVHGGAH